MICELSIVPLGVGVSVSKYVAEAIRTLDRLGVKYVITPMCTVFEAESHKEAFRIAAEAHEAVLRIGAIRVVTTLKIDDRRDVKRGMMDKVEAVKRKISVT